MSFEIENFKEASQGLLTVKLTYRRKKIVIEQWNDSIERFEW